MDLTDNAKKIFENIKGFISNNNYKILEVRECFCKLEGIITETSFNNLDIAHGGYIFGLADTAGGIAAMSTGKKVVTINSSISYIKPAKGDRLIAIAECIQKGSTICTYEIKIYNTKEELVSFAVMTYRYIK